MLDMYSILRAGFLSIRLKDALSLASSDTAAMTPFRAQNIEASEKILSELADVMGFRVERKADG